MAGLLAKVSVVSPDPPMFMFETPVYDPHGWYSFIPFEDERKV